MKRDGTAAERRTWLGVAAVFVAAGPAIGGAIAIALAGVLYGFHGLLTYIGVGAVLGYLAGFLPAGLTGIICGLLSSKIPGAWAWLVVCLLVGGVVSVAIGLGVVWIMAPGNSVALMGDLQMVEVYGAVGAVSALGCGLVERNTRPLMPRKSAATRTVSAIENPQPQP